MSRRFDRATVCKMMRRMSLVPSWLEGENRARHSSIRFETMDTLRSPVDYFSKAMEIELEHGSINPDTNVTKDTALSTAKIVKAHLMGVEADEQRSNWRPFPAYYDSLIFMEKYIRV